MSENPTKNILNKVLFIDLAIIKVKINPEAPTKQPATISAVFDKRIPAIAAAIPDNELSKEITTGISPPPIGKTNAKPDKSEITSSPKKTILMISKSKTKKPKEEEITCSIAIAK